MEKARNILDDHKNDELQGYRAEIDTSSTKKKDKVGRKEEPLDTYEDEFEEEIEEDLPDDNHLLESNDNVGASGGLRMNAGHSLGGMTVS